MTLTENKEYLKSTKHQEIMQKSCPNLTKALKQHKILLA